MEPVEQVRALAYRLWEDAGCPDGCAEEHWLEAERRCDHPAAPEDPDAQIRLEAYRIWEREGWPSGRALDHWRQAEAMVAPEAAALPAASGAAGGTTTGRRSRGRRSGNGESV